MQDFDRTRQRKNNEMPITKHPEYAMYLSTGTWRAWPAHACGRQLAW